MPLPVLLVVDEHRDALESQLVHRYAGDYRVESLSPNVRDVGYKATPAGWAEHHHQTEAEQYLGALEDRP